VCMAAFAATPTITGVTAQQRYPWNGLVDLKFTINGDDDKLYSTSVVARDLLAGTNIIANTIYNTDGTLVSKEEMLSPRAYNWVWDATADLPEGWNSEVSVKVEAEEKSPSPTVKSGLVAWWPFNGNLNDCSGNKHHLDGTVTYVSGRRSESFTAAHFTGTSFLTQKTNLGVSGAMTIACWVNNPTHEVPKSDIEDHLGTIGRGNYGQGWVHFAMIVFPSYVSSGRGIGLSVAKNRIDVFAHGSSFYNVFLGYPVSITSGWHHIAITVGKSATPILYYDGVKVATGSTSWNGYEVYLDKGSSIGGGNTYSGNNYYKGDIDDIVVYNRILSANEIKQLYDDGK